MRVSAVHKGGPRGGPAAAPLLLGDGVAGRSCPTRNARPYASLINMVLGALCVARRPWAQASWCQMAQEQAQREEQPPSKGSWRPGAAGKPWNDTSRGAEHKINHTPAGLDIHGANAVLGSPHTHRLSLLFLQLRCSTPSNPSLSLYLLRACFLQGCIGKGGDTAGPS